nr:nucleocapsid protein [Avian paramyxovirus 14]
MSSVFNEYEKLQDLLVQPQKKRVDATGTSLLKVTIPVCITMSDEMEERYALAMLAMRWISSANAPDAVRIGAMITVLSLHAGNMRSHAMLAARSPDSEIQILEVEEIDNDNKTIRFSGRSGVPDGRARQLFALAIDTMSGCANGSPFINGGIEQNPPGDMTELLEMIHSMAAQVWIAAMKSMTAPDSATESEARRTAKYAQQGRINKATLVHPAVRAEFTRLVRKAMVLRAFMIQEIRRASSMSGEHSRYYAMVGDMGAYFRNQGLASFFLTLRFGVGTRFPALAISALSADLKKVKSLIKLYQQKGDNAAFMAFLEDPQMMDFAPGNYTLLYSYAMGVGSILESSVGKYQFARTFLNETFFRLGIDTAQKHQSSLDEETANELGLTKEARQSVKELVASIDITGGDQIQPQAPAFLDQSASQRIGDTDIGSNQLSTPMNRPRTPDYDSPQNPDDSTSYDLDF